MFLSLSTAAFPLLLYGPSVLMPLWQKKCKHSSITLFCCNLIILALTHCHTQVSSPKAQEKPSWSPVPCDAGLCIRKHNECFMSSLPRCVSMSLSLNDHFHKTYWCLPTKKIAGKGGRTTVNFPAVLGGARSYLKWIYVPRWGLVSLCGSKNAYSTRSTIQLMVLLLNYRPWRTQNKNWLDQKLLALHITMAIPLSPSSYLWRWWPLQ